MPKLGILLLFFPRFVHMRTHSPRRSASGVHYSTLRVLLAFSCYSTILGNKEQLCLYAMVSLRKTGLRSLIGVYVCVNLREIQMQTIVGRFCKSTRLPHAQLYIFNKICRSLTYSHFITRFQIMACLCS